MKKITISILVLAILAITRVTSTDDRGDLSNGDAPLKFSDLPNDIQSDFFKIVTGAFNDLGGSCLGVEPNYDRIELLLYHDNPKSYTKQDPLHPSGVDKNAPLYILTHGWLSGLDGYKMKPLRDKYIKMYGKNILYVNWGALAWLPYPTSVCNVPFIGQHIAKYLCALSEKENFDLENVHMVGHSLGGHVSGFTGKGVQKLCSKTMGRITALDPAGPLFMFKTEKNRLAPSDATLVEAVHSNAGVFGFLGKIAMVDYYLNCGTFQPGCIVAEDFSKMAETSFFVLACAHMRSVDIWPYIIESDQFKAQSCKACAGIMPHTCIPDLFGGNIVKLGHTKGKPVSEHYNVATGPYPPYTLGCIPSPLQKCT